MKIFPFLKFVLSKIDPPMILTSDKNGGFRLVSAYRVDSKPVSPPWFYGFYNRSKLTVDTVFPSIKYLLDTIFSTEEIWYGPLKWSNNLYGKKDTIKIMYDLEKP